MTKTAGDPSSHTVDVLPILSPLPDLVGRSEEQAVLDHLVARAGSSEGTAVVLRGAPGIGKSALLHDLVERSSGCRTVVASAAAAETCLAYAALHQLCTPLVDVLDELSGVQRRALDVVFGTCDGPSPDPLVVGRGVTRLLALAATDRPLLCVVDDLHDADPASSRILGFVARRVPAAVVLAFATDGETPGALRGVPELEVSGLSRADAHRLLESTVGPGSDVMVRERMVAECDGNPRALLAVGRATKIDCFAGELASLAEPEQFGAVLARIEHGLVSLPPPTRRLLVVLAASPVLDSGLVERAVARLEVSLDALVPAASAGIVELGPPLRFRHPLARSAVYSTAPPDERAAAHRALAAGEIPAPAGRRAWHLALATIGTDDVVAGELEAAARVQLHRPSVAAHLERAALLTADVPTRSSRALSAADAWLSVERPSDAARLLDVAGASGLDARAQAVARALRVRVALSSRPREGLVGFGKADSLLDALDPGAARSLCRDVLVAALGQGAASPAVAAAVLRRRRDPGQPHPEDVLLDGIAIAMSGDRRRATPSLRRAVQAVRQHGCHSDDLTSWRSLAVFAAQQLWDAESWIDLAEALIDAARSEGRESTTLAAVASAVAYDVLAGDLRSAHRRAAASPRGAVRMSAPQRALLALQRPLSSEGVDGDGPGIVEWARAVHANATGHSEIAVAAAGTCAADGVGGPSDWSLAELVEGAAHIGAEGRAHAALEQLADVTSASGTDWALGVAARARALLAADASAEALHREAVERLRGTAMRTEAARALLAYGEWLRRRGRRVDARAQLTAAFDSFVAIGLQAFAERAARELRATGATARRRSVETAHQLTPQELHVARLAGEGLSNAEIAAAMYIGRRTVEWHLRKVFSKLGITSRRELRSPQSQSHIVG